MANIKIKINNLLNNIRIIKNSYNYDYLNNAFNHGMYITKYLEDIDYFYVDSLSDVISLRKYLKKADIIYKGRLSEENIYDLILNEAILVLDNIDILKNLEINEEIRVILDINKDNNMGINTQEKVKNIKEYFKEKIKYKIEGIMAHIKEDEYLEYKEIMYPLKDVKLKILNNESDKQKIKISNAIKVDGKRKKEYISKALS